MEEYIENERFNAAKEKIIGKKHNDKGIGKDCSRCVETFF